MAMNDDDDDVADLVGLVQELNSHADLKVKLTNQSKICKFLSDVGGADISGAASGMARPSLQHNARPPVKDYKAEIGRAKSEFGKLGF